MGGKDDLLKKEYIEAQGKINLKELAKKYNIKYATLRSRKKRDEWDKGLDNGLDKVDKKTEEMQRPRKKMQRQQKTVIDNATVATVTTKDDNILFSATNATENATVKCNTTQKNDATDSPLHMKLTSKQMIFCQEYCTDYNGSRAAIAAGYSAKSARSIAYRMLTKDYIQAVIRKFQKLAMEVLKIDQNKIISEFANIAFADITTYIDVGRKRISKVDKAGKKISEMQDYCHLKTGQLFNANIIQEIKITDQGTTIKMFDKLKALDALVRISGMASDNAKAIEVQKLKILQEKVKFEAQKGLIANDNGNLDELLKSITNIDMTVFDKEGD